MRSGDKIKDSTETTFSEAEYKSVQSPSTGFLTDIDRETGEITIQYKSKPYFMHSFVNGIVAKIEEGLSVDIEVEGASADCVIGFGGENHGELKIADVMLDDTFENKIAVFFQPISLDTLNLARTHNVKGIISHGSAARKLGKDERPTSNVQRRMSNSDVASLFKLF